MGRFREPFRTTIVPLLLMLTTPLAIIALWMACTDYEGSLRILLSEFDLRGWWARWPRPTLAAAKIIGVFALVEALLMALLPGKTHFGPVTPTGNRPRYKLNGIPALAATLLLYYLGAYRLRLFSPSIVFDQFGSILTTLTVASLLFCVFLYFKGSYFPSSADAGRSGNPIWDFFWGVELHPEIRGFNLKQYANCRLGMMGWAVIILSFLAKQEEIYGRVSSSMLVSTALQMAYIVKFFYWESGYFNSLDIMHDRFGYYICWGVLCWVPGVYTLTSQYLVTHPFELPLPWALACMALGLVAIWANYDADAQRQRVRATGGKTTVWGRPPEVVVATWRAGDGVERENLLLASGWWGLARHFHYVPEIALSIAWSLPAGFRHFLPWFYVVFLTILLVDRSGRDERRCRAKYGDSWGRYCERVPYRILPYLFLFFSILAARRDA